MRRQSGCQFKAAVATAAVLCTSLRCGPVRPPPLRPPPPIRPPGVKAGLPPPPPLPGKLSTINAFSWKSPQDILSLFIDFIPTFYVPIGCVAATLSDDCRALVKGKGKFALFLKKYRFFFDVRTTDTGCTDVRLSESLSHPKRGAADHMYAMTDVGENRTYTVKPEFVTSVENIELSSESVSVRPDNPPPSIHVRMEERVPVVDRLKALVPDKFTMIEEVEEKIPEDILFHPYFDCQGGLSAVASKFPELFQVVEGLIRLRPPHLAPLSTNDFSLDNSPISSVAAKVRETVCRSDVPQWVSLTQMYETLTQDEKRAIKKEFKSFAGFLRAHGRSLAISPDTLKVSQWIAPTARKTASSSSSDVTIEGKSKIYTPTQVLNELFDKFPRGKSLNLEETLALVPRDMRFSIPKKVVFWLASNSKYFVVDNATEQNPKLVQIRRATDTVPLDIAQGLYAYIPEDGIPQQQLLDVIPETLRELVTRLGLPNVIGSLPDWLELVDGDVFRKRSELELETAIQCEESKVLAQEEGGSSHDADQVGGGVDKALEEKEMRYSASVGFRGTMSQGVGR